MRHAKNVESVSSGGTERAQKYPIQNKSNIRCHVNINFYETCSTHVTSFYLKSNRKKY